MDYGRDGFWKGVGYWIYDLQGLVAGILALVAALITVYYLKRQIRQANEFREIDRKEKLKSDTINFFSEYAEMINGVLNYYQRIKKLIPDGHSDELWPIIPHLIELDTDFLRFSNSSTRLFIGQNGGQLLTDLLLFQTSRNRLAITNKTWNSIRYEGDLLFEESSHIDESSNRIVTNFDSTNVKHRTYQLKAEKLLESIIFAAEDQINDIIKLQPRLAKYFQEKLEDPTFRGYDINEDYIAWFTLNSSDQN